jgi:uncharacterized protein
MTKRYLGSLVLFLMVATCSWSQQAPAKAGRDEILKLLELLQVKARLVQLFQGMTDQAVMGAEQSFKGRVPDATPEQLEKVDALAREIFADMPVDELLNAMVPIYQKHLTHADVQAVVSFYSSPVGQKLLEETPAMMSEGMQAGGEIGRRIMEEKSKRLDERVADLVKLSQQKVSPGERTQPR